MAGGILLINAVMSAIYAVKESAEEIHRCPTVNFVARSGYYIHSFSLVSGVAGILGYPVVLFAFRQPPFEGSSMVYHKFICLIEFLFSICCVVIYSQTMSEMCYDDNWKCTIMFYAGDYLNCVADAITLAISIERLMAISAPNVFMKLQLHSAKMKATVAAIVLVLAPLIKIPEACVIVGPLLLIDNPCGMNDDTVLRSVL